jgi:hypothetical protein
MRMAVPAGIYYMDVSVPAGICAIFGVLKLVAQKNYLIPAGTDALSRNT